MAEYRLFTPFLYRKSPICSNVKHPAQIMKLSFHLPTSVTLSAKSTQNANTKPICNVPISPSKKSSTAKIHAMWKLQQKNETLITNKTSHQAKILKCLYDRCPVLSVCLSVCDVGVLWLNGWMDQDETCHAGRPWPWPHCVRWGSAPPPQRGTAPPIFGPYLLWSNSWRSRCHLAWRQTSAQATLCYMGTQLTIPPKGT